MKKQPNILLITADQMRWDCLGCMDNPVIKTPNIDKLASKGVIFKNAFSPDPICVPARASIMTGNYPQTCTGKKQNNGKIKDGQPLLTELLKQVGYRAYAVGKLHFLPYSPPNKERLLHGFEHVDLHESGRILAKYDPEGELSGVEDYFDYLKSVGYYGYTRANGIGNNDVRPAPSPLPIEHNVDHWIADRTINRVDSHLKENPDNPFFIWMSSPKPHSPYEPPRPYDTMYDPKAIPKPYGNKESLKGINPAVERAKYTHGVDSISPQAWQVIRSYYYGTISFLDAMIGRVIEHLEEVDMLDNTIILFTADHGDLLGDFGSCFKSNHLNGSVRVPFIIAGPGISSGKISDALVGLQDILPTFAKFADSEIGQNTDGIDLTSHLANTNLPLREYYYSTTMNAEKQSAMVTDGKWKYIYSEENATEELYNEIDDVGEVNNLVNYAAFKEMKLMIRKKLAKFAKKYNDQAFSDSESFPARNVDRESLKDLPIKGIGWRWY